MHRVIPVTVCIFLLAISACDRRETKQSDAAELDKMLDDAVGEIGHFSFDRAYKLFKDVKEQAAVGSQQWQQGVYGTAVCLQQISPPTQANIEKAQDFYELLIKKCPSSKFAPRAKLNLGRIAELSDYYQDKVDLKAARNWYQKVVDEWPDDIIAGEATLRVAATYIQTYQDDQVRKGIGILQTWLAGHSQDPLASAMWQYLGNTYFYPLEDYAKSLDCYRKAEAIGFTEKGREGPIYWRMAAMADRFLNDRDKAVEYYTKIITLVPTSGKAYEAQLALQRLGAPVPKIKVFENLMGDSGDSLDQPAEKDTAK